MSRVSGARNKALITTSAFRDMMKTDRPLRFCMITTFYPPYSFGGDGIFVHRLSNELAVRGHEVDVIHCVDSYLAMASGEPANAPDNRPGVRVHSLRSKVGVLSPLATQQTGMAWFKSAAIKEILSQRFDVIHYHNISLVGGPDLLRYGEGIKLYTTHEYWLVCPTHLLYRFNRAPCEVPHCFLCSLTYKRPPAAWRYTGMLKDAVRHVDAFIAPSLFSMQAQRNRGLNAPFVHLPLFAPRLPLVTEGPVDAARPPYFLFVGRLEEVKGLQTLLPLFKRDVRANLLIAGTGSQEDSLRELAAASNNVHFLGQLPETDLQPLYRNAVALIVPSICFEISPLVIIEAFRQQTPVLARRLGGMVEMIEESGGGSLYESDEELTAAMDRLLADAPYRREAGLRGYAAYERTWSAEVHFERYFSLIREIRDSRQGLGVR